MNDKRVVRGGSWRGGQRLARCSSRTGLDPAIYGHHLGFRIVIPDNQELPDTRRRVVRGSSWYDDQRDARCASSRRFVPDYFNGRLGFRIVIQDNQESPDTRVVCGGAYFNEPGDGHRGWQEGGDKKESTGFRVVIREN